MPLSDLLPPPLPLACCPTCMCVMILGTLGYINLPFPPGPGEGGDAFSILKVAENCSFTQGMLQAPGIDTHV
jgi:hypothetical protein